jgi:ergothioneine biosynthesis protein EgtB
MSSTNPLPGQAVGREQPEPPSRRFQRIRRVSLELTEPLETEDMVIQSMPDASPARWHLAHTTWFFEHFLLGPYAKRYRPYREGWDYLFNSYYYSVGEMHQRPRRGLLSRPTVAEVLAYRAHVDEHMLGLIESQADDAEVAFLVELGLNHEQQHQELILTDIKHALSLNPLKPSYRANLAAGSADHVALGFSQYAGGVIPIGAADSGFCFDNETPRHEVLLQPFALANRPVTSGEFLEFVQDGGYERTEWWLSEGWATVCEQGWQRPIYWSEGLDSEFSLAGEIELDPNRAACHISYYEADAYARWAGARLPLEAEWEHVATRLPVSGNLLDLRRLHPGGAAAGPSQFFGDVWEWTASPYSAYPGFRPLNGSLGEYNGKFMCSQLVLRGGSCASPKDHIRASYRNFFYPDARWQFSGIRLARDGAS